MNRLRLGLAVSAAAGLLSAGAASASYFGMLGNFDVVNDTGSTAHGFEIELEGLRLHQITDTFGGPGRGFPTGTGFDPATSVVRYGSPTLSEYTDPGSGTFGTRVRYLSAFDGTNWAFGTPSGSFITPGDNCWSGGGVGYGPGTPCDHFGVGTSANPTKTTYNWLIETNQPGVLTNGTVTLPAPAWNVVQQAPVGNQAPPPIVVAQIRAPAAEFEAQFGEAIWVKVYTTEYEDPIRLEELVGDNPKIRQAETEIEWQLLQKDPGNPNSGQLESGLGVPVGPNAASIVRRYEFFKYAGPYDPENHEAQPFGNDSNPDPLDIGIYLGAQNGAVNLAAVPEPATYALLLAGLSIVAVGARRHRNSGA
jgi:hypothetical protein